MWMKELFLLTTQVICHIHTNIPLWKLTEIVGHHSIWWPRVSFTVPFRHMATGVTVSILVLALTTVFDSSLRACQT